MTLEPVESLLERKRRVTESGCWEWTGGLHVPCGYGVISRGGGKPRLYAHREAFRLYVGPIPDGYDVCHRCDNPPCFNPEHLFVGTRLDNMRDAKAKGRTRRGERHGASKLSDAQAEDIRREYATGQVRQRDLAARYGVCQQLVSLIVNNRVRVAS